MFFSKSTLLYSFTCFACGETCKRRKNCWGTPPNPRQGAAPLASPLEMRPPLCRAIHLQGFEALFAALRFIGVGVQRQSPLYGCEGLGFTSQNTEHPGLAIPGRRVAFVMGQGALEIGQRIFVAGMHRQAGPFDVPGFRVSVVQRDGPLGRAERLCIANRVRQLLAIVEPETRLLLPGILLVAILHEHQPSSCCCRRCHSSTTRW